MLMLIFSIVILMFSVALVFLCKAHVREARTILKETNKIYDRIEDRENKL